MAHRASNECRILAMSGVVVSTVENSSSLVILSWEAAKKSDKTSLIIDL